MTSVRPGSRILHVYIIADSNAVCIWTNVDPANVLEERSLPASRDQPASGTLMSTAQVISRRMMNWLTSVSQLFVTSRRSRAHVFGVVSLIGKANMTSVDFEPLNVTVPLWEDPPGVFRVGKSRVLLELVLGAFKRGETPEGIVRSYRTLQLADVYAVISRYLADPLPFDEYLRGCDEEAKAVRRKIEASQRPGPGKEELTARARSKGLIP